MRALRRGHQETEDQFPRDVVEILQYFKAPQPGQRIIATPGQNTHVPVWLLGSSLFSAQLAAKLGLPYSFASHFAPRMLGQAIELYRENFEPSEYLDKPYVSMGVPVVVANTDEEAQFLATSAYQRVLGLIRGESLQLKPPVNSIQGLWNTAEQLSVENFYQMAQIGSAETVRSGLESFWLHMKSMSLFLLVTSMIQINFRQLYSINAIKIKSLISYKVSCLAQFQA